MSFRRKLPDRDTLAAHLAAGMTVDHIAGTYECEKSSVWRRLQSYGLMPVKPKQTPVEEAGRGPGPRSRSKRGILLKDDRIIFVRERTLESGGMEIRPLSLPRISMHLGAIADKKLKITEMTNATV